MKLLRPLMVVYLCAVPSVANAQNSNMGGTYEGLQGLARRIETTILWTMVVRTCGG